MGSENLVQNNFGKFSNILLVTALSGLAAFLLAKLMKRNRNKKEYAADESTWIPLEENVEYLRLRKGDLVECIFRDGRMMYGVVTHVATMNYKYAFYDKRVDGHIGDVWAIWKEDPVEAIKAFKNAPDNKFKILNNRRWASPVITKDPITGQINNYFDILKRGIRHPSEEPEDIDFANLTWRANGTNPINLARGGTNKFLRIEDSTNQSNSVESSHAELTWRTTSETSNDDTPPDQIDRFAVDNADIKGIEFGDLIEYETKNDKWYCKVVFIAEVNDNTSIFGFHEVANRKNVIEKRIKEMFNSNKNYLKSIRDEYNNKNLTIRDSDGKRIIDKMYEKIRNENIKFFGHNWITDMRYIKVLERYHDEPENIDFANLTWRANGTNPVSISDTDLVTYHDLRPGDLVEIHNVLEYMHKFGVVTSVGHDNYNYIDRAGRLSHGRIGDVWMVKGETQDQALTRYLNADIEDFDLMNADNIIIYTPAENEDEQPNLFRIISRGHNLHEEPEDVDFANLTWRANDTNPINLARGGGAYTRLIPNVLNEIRELVGKDEAFAEYYDYPFEVRNLGDIWMVGQDMTKKENVASFYYMYLPFLEQECLKRGKVPYDMTISRSITKPLTMDSFYYDFMLSKDYRMRHGLSDNESLIAEADTPEELYAYWSSLRDLAAYGGEMGEINAEKLTWRASETKTGKGVDKTKYDPLIDTLKFGDLVWFRMPKDHGGHTKYCKFLFKFKDDDYDENYRYYIYGIYGKDRKTITEQFENNVEFARNWSEYIKEKPTLKEKLDTSDLFDEISAEYEKFNVAFQWAYNFTDMEIVQRCYEEPEDVDFAELTWRSDSDGPYHPSTSSPANADFGELTWRTDNDNTE